MSWEVRHGDCLELMRAMPDNSVDAVVTDPPYGLSFMGKKWDYDVPSVEVWAECLRVLKPGGHLLAFAGTRTQHRMAVRIEDAGFEIRDMIAWVYGSGFPKSHNVAIAIDKLNGAPHRGKALVVAGRGEREDLQGKDANPRPQDLEAYAPTTEAAKQWQGWGTALKPSLEPVTVARKPLVGTVAENVLEHGTGAINIDGCRVASTGEDLGGGGVIPGNAAKIHEGWQRPWMKDEEANNRFAERQRANIAKAEHLGRYPANLIHDGSEEVLAHYPITQGGGAHVKKRGRSKNCMGEANATAFIGINDQGSAARFFYCAKPSKREKGSSNNHPTVKPLALMRYLCRLVTPPGGVVLDPFMGSGTTGKAAKLEGFNFIGLEREAEYVDIARARIAAVEPERKEPEQPTLFDQDAA